MQSNQPICPLCSGPSEKFESILTRSYLSCQNCLSIFVPPQYHLSLEEEKERYLFHNNDVNDSKYQEFVSPIVDAIKSKYSTLSMGLDFGAGTGPVSAKLLHDNGYLVDLYDPFFWNDTDKLNRKYDFILACEVIEHFRNPYLEFSRLRNMLSEAGSIFCMTSLYNEGIDFRNWYYKNDRTHLFFYHARAIDWITENFHFKFSKINGNLIEFSC